MSSSHFKCVYKCCRLPNLHPQPTRFSPEFQGHTFTCFLDALPCLTNTRRSYVLNCTHASPHRPAPPASLSSPSWLLAIPHPVAQPHTCSHTSLRFFSQTPQPIYEQILSSFPLKCIRIDPSQAPPLLPSCFEPAFWNYHLCPRLLL